IRRSGEQEREDQRPPAPTNIGERMADPDRVEAAPAAIRAARHDGTPKLAQVEIADSDPLSIVRAAYQTCFGHPPEWDRRDVSNPAYLAKLAALDREVLAEVARLFFASPGKRSGDGYWAARGWSLHLLVTQGVPELRASAEAAVRERPARRTSFQDAFPPL